MRSTGTIVKLVIGVIIGVGLLIGGITTLSSNSVTCGGQTMSGSQTCTERSRHGSTTTRTVDQQRGNNTTTGWVLVGFGALLLLCSGGALIMGFAKGNKDRAMSLPGAYHGQQPQQFYGQQPQQFYGQQPQQQYGQQPQQQAPQQQWNQYPPQPPASG